MRRLLVVLLLALSTCCLAEDSLPDMVVGHWVSSSGTPLSLAYSDNIQKVWLSIDGGPNIDVWLATGRDGVLRLDYTAPDGDAMQGTLQGDGSISVTNSSQSFRASWQRQ